MAWEANRPVADGEEGRPRSRRKELIVDLRNGSRPKVGLRLTGESNDTLSDFFFGAHTPLALMWRVVLDVLFVVCGVGITLILLRPGRSPTIASVLTALLIAGPALIVTGTYGFLGTPRRIVQFGRLFTGVLLGSGLELAALGLAGVEGNSTALVAGWLGGGSLSVAARLAKTRFEDGFRVLRRSARPGAHCARQVDHPIRHVLLIGGAGFIGSVLSRQLLDRGYHVTVLDKLVYGDVGTAGLAGHPRFRLVRDDFRNVEALVLAARGAEAVIHLGAIVGDPACAINPEKAIDVNYRATRLIHSVCRGLGVQRLIFASTCSVYGRNGDIIDERSELNPVSVYAASKIASEKAILEEAHNGLSATVLRLATVFGWSPRPRFDLVVNLFTARAIAGDGLEIHGGSQWRPFVHVVDVASAFRKCLEAPVSHVRDQTFNIGCDTLNLTLDELGTVFQDLFPGLDVRRTDVNSDARSYRVSFRKIETELGFRAKVGLEQGIEELRRMMTEKGITDYSQPQFSNVRLLEANPHLAVGPDDEEMDPQLRHLRSLYDHTKEPAASISRRD